MSDSTVEYIGACGCGSRFELRLTRNWVVAGTVSHHLCNCGECYLVVARDDHGNPSVRNSRGTIVANTIIAAAPRG